MPDFPPLQEEAGFARGPWIDASPYNDLLPAISAIGTNELTLLISEPFQAIKPPIKPGKPPQTTLTVPANVTLQFLRGGRLVIKDKQTIYICGDVQAGAHQVFDFEGNGKMHVCPSPPTPPVPVTLNVLWFGAKPDGSPDSTKAIQRAIDALPATGGTVLLPVGTYVTSGTLVARSNLVLSGDGVRLTGAVVKPHITNKAAAFEATSVENLTFKDITFDGDKSDGDGIVLQGTAASPTTDVQFYSVAVKFFNERIRPAPSTHIERRAGLVLEYCRGLRCFGCSFTENGTGVETRNGPVHDAYFAGCDFHHHLYGEKNWGVDIAGTGLVFDNPLLEGQYNGIRIREISKKERSTGIAIRESYIEAGNVDLKVAVCLRGCTAARVENPYLALKSTSQPLDISDSRHVQVAGAIYGQLAQPLKIDDKSDDVAVQNCAIEVDCLIPKCAVCKLHEGGYIHESLYWSTDNTPAAGTYECFHCRTQKTLAAGVPLGPCSTCTKTPEKFRRVW